MYVREPHPHDGVVEVRKRKGGSVYFVVRGAPLEALDLRKLREYLEGCNWTDFQAPGWITPELRCDDFMLEETP